MKQVARMLRSREELILNWFRAPAEISLEAVVGLQQRKIRVVNQTFLWLPYLSIEGNRALSHTLPAICPKMGSDSHHGRTLSQLD